MYKLDGKAKNLFFAPWQVLAIVEGKAFGLLVNLGIDVIRFVRRGVGDLMEFFRPD